ncbi:glycosyltransferase [Psychroflexus tropicus]|uniref:glycosyltransferase n=1 Tax=Psychroflexus tropicus TaxID=197345 RepID=UPI000477FFB5|nr:glycosyltransferase [Psychroflexus tropicus]
MALPTHVLVSPLNWGLGHASRCVPVIAHCLKLGCKVSIASDGNALSLLKDEFPTLSTLELNSSTVSYSKSGLFFYLKLVLQGFGLQKRALKDEQLVEDYVQKHGVDLIISDHRFGAFSPSVKSVIICHQLQFKAGLFSFTSSYFNAKQLNRFAEVWVPDTLNEQNLSGVLSKSSQVKVPVIKVGILSRFKKEEKDKTIDYLAIISGPEPLRTQLENQLIRLFKTLGSKSCVLIRGVYEKDSLESTPNLKIYNHLKSEELNSLINQSRLVICRSGYSSVMDLACLGKKAFFIPTPHQGEQIYLAKRLEQMKIAPFCPQKDFTNKDLRKSELYSGFKSSKFTRFPPPQYPELLEV